MTQLRARVRSSKKTSKVGTERSKLTIILVILPVVIITTVAVLWLILPAGAFSPNQPDARVQPSVTVDLPAIVAKINLPLEPPEPESQETSKQIAEQKRLAEIERQRLEQERILALEKALKIKQARDEARNKICFIGDSITRGGAAESAISLLNSGHPADDLPYDNINIARDGSTTSDWVATIVNDTQACRKANLKVVMIMLGTNDAGQKVPLATYLSNMAYIKSIADSLGASAVVVNCPISLGSLDGQATIAEYCNALGANGVSSPLSVSLADGIHPDSNGYSALGQVWANIIKSWVGV
jgi:lysophospholipase L1-like esterase